MKRSRWYAIRVAPGHQRMAAADGRLPESRRMESIIERNCRKDGVDIFMPSFHAELKHHRTNKIIQKRLLAGPPRKAVGERPKFRSRSPELVLNTIGTYTPVHRHCYER
ncbi:hypothetical protein ABIA16_003743 [Sinorhizobium fredii]